MLVCCLRSIAKTYCQFGVFVATSELQLVVHMIARVLSRPRHLQEISRKVLKPVSIRPQFDATISVRKEFVPDVL